jgi:hypothetical protein
MATENPQTHNQFYETATAYVRFNVRMVSAIAFCKLASVNFGTVGKVKWFVDEAAKGYMLGWQSGVRV